MTDEDKEELDMEKKQTEAGKIVITDEIMEYVGILAKLELLDYVGKLNQLDTSGVEPMSDIFSVSNVFREDQVEHKDGAEDALANAPKRRGQAFVVPRTVDL